LLRVKNYGLDPKDENLYRKFAEMLSLMDPGKFA
jgi:hypothetical protein